MNTKAQITFLTAACWIMAATASGQPVITSSPQSVTNLAGTTATFSVTASSTPPLAYQWLFNSTIALANATNADLILTNVQSAKGS